MDELHGAGELGGEPLSGQCTVTRRDKWVITVGGDKLTIARNEHSDWLDITTTDGELLISDIQRLIEWARREGVEA